MGEQSGAHLPPRAVHLARPFPGMLPRPRVLPSCTHTSRVTSPIPRAAPARLSQHLIVIVTQHARRHRNPNQTPGNPQGPRVTRRQTQAGSAS